MAAARSSAAGGSAWAWALGWEAASGSLLASAFGDGVGVGAGVDGRGRRRHRKNRQRDAQGDPDRRERPRAAFRVAARARLVERMAGERHRSSRRRRAGDPENGSVARREADERVVVGGVLERRPVTAADRSEVDACQRWTAADVWPLTETIATAETANDEGTSTSTQVISSPPPLPPTFFTFSVTVTGTPTEATSGDPVNVQRRAASVTPGSRQTSRTARIGAAARARVARTVTRRAASTGRESTTTRAAARRRPSRCPSTNALDEALVELACPAASSSRVQRLPDVERLAVRPRRRHRRERVADRQDPGDQRDLLAGEPVEVAVAVPALVVVADAGPDRARCRAGRGRSCRRARRAA